jgi:subtilisin family serine protease
MSKLDPGLKYLASASAADLQAIAMESAFGVDTAAVGQPRASVLVEVEPGGGAEAALAAIGFVTRTRAGNVLTGEIPVDRIEALGSVPGLVRAEVSRVLAQELDRALPEARVSAAHGGAPPRLGRGVIVGVIDSGIDYQHRSFRRADGTSRILAIWDQRLRPNAGETNPAGFAFGVEYDRAAINAALGSATPLALVRHVDLAPFHGTHVAGIAAGNGQPTAASAGALRFLGVAPEAELIVVANTRGRANNERGLGDSADTLDAVQYILALANALGRPVAINQSQGDNVGPHDGTSLLEVGMAGLITGPGNVLIKSAGNEGARNRHAQGALAGGATQDVRVQVPANTPEVIIDLWYPGADRIGVRITPPGAGATATAVIVPQSTVTLPLSNGNEAFVDADLNDPGNGDNRTFIVLGRGSGVFVQGGTWTFRLSGATIVDGSWHAWIQRNSFSEFHPPFVDSGTTISIPGTSPAVITAGAYVSNGGGAGTAVGTLSSFSSRGPTRDGRQAPTLAAPGETLTAPQPAPATFGPMAGTSMAAPMVTGTAALMLEIDATQTAADVRRCLEQTARNDGQTGGTPNNDWGAGKLDTSAACQCAGT